MENNNTLMDAVKEGNLSIVQALVHSGADINVDDERGWTPLNFAAGRGDLPIVKLLVENGADVFKVGLDRRTPYKIALAAGRIDVARYLREVEDKVDPEKAKALRDSHIYCKAYYLGDMRKFPGWSEGRVNWDKENEQRAVQKQEEQFTDSKIVYLHQDFTVTESMWRNRNVIFNQNSQEWQNFCKECLGFKVPDDFDLIPRHEDESEK